VSLNVIESTVIPFCSDILPLLNIYGVRFTVSPGSMISSPSPPETSTSLNCKNIEVEYFRAFYHYFKKISK
jgi:hypothetical protein